MCSAGAQGPGPWNHCMPSEVAIQSMDLPRVRKAYAPVGCLLQPHSEGLGKVRTVSLSDTQPTH